jgi:hypothetical protein
MKQIRITRSGSTVTFETVSVDTTETVFFLNLDPLAEHWPTIAANKLGPAPSAPSSQCFPQASYGCQIAGHGSERGIINIFQPLASANTKLKPATRGYPIALQLVVQGGMSPYQISGAVFQVVDSGGTVIQSGSGIGPGLQLTPLPNNSGIFVQGTPTLSGTYKFTFVVDDGMGRNLQQVQYSMVVT